MQYIDGLVSIVMPCYNNGAFISEAIDSVLKQTYRSWELIVVDDCSTDGSIDNLSRMGMEKHRNRIVFIRNNSNMGAAYSRNRAIDSSRGEYIAFLDADDVWLSNKLQVQIGYLESNPSVAAVCSSYSRMDEGGSDLSVREIGAERRIELSETLEFNPIGCLTVVLHRDRVSIPIVFPGYRKRQDWALWLNIISAGNVFMGLAQVLAKYRVGSSSLSSNKFSAASYCWMIYREHMGYSVSKSFRHFCQYMLKNVLFRVGERADNF